MENINEQICAFVLYFWCVGIPMTIIFLIAVWGYLYLKDDKQKAFGNQPIREKYKHGGIVDGTKGTIPVTPNDVLVGIGVLAIVALPIYLMEMRKRKR